MSSIATQAFETATELFSSKGGLRDVLPVTLPPDIIPDQWSMENGPKLQS